MNKRPNRAIRAAHSVVNFATLTALVLLVAFAGYALWDGEQLYGSAELAHYELYKPTVKNEGKSFEELQAINSEVFAWLDVYGTNIDYPVLQSSDNQKYVNTNAEGEYSVIGSIFLDSENSKDFSDFNNILHGHHMERHAMFGEIGTFVDKEVFDSHPFGNIYYNGRNKGIEFIAFVQADSYDAKIYTANVPHHTWQSYLNELRVRTIHTRNIEVAADDHLIMLSTCSPDSTNGRDILVGRITDEVYENTFTDDDSTGGIRFFIDKPNTPFGVLKSLSSSFTFDLILLLVCIVFLVALSLIIRHFRRRAKKRNARKST